MKGRALFSVWPALGMLLGCQADRGEAGAGVDVDVGAAADGAAAKADGGGSEGAADAPASGEADGPSVDAPAGAADAAVAPDVALVPRRVLFVGNSYTEQNNLPAVVRALGTANGTSLTVESITPGGARFADHWLTTGARARIETGNFDAVVLQGQSLEPIFEADGFVGYGSALGEAVRDAGAAAVWFATWARREGDPIYAQWAMSTPASMTSTLDWRYEMMVEEDDGVARVGAAWQLARAALPAVALHADDGSHPSAAGTLLAGCVILQAITRQPPRLPDPPPLGVPPDTAAALCAIAPKVRCLADETFCGGSCVDLASDVNHCGACGVTCAAEDPCRDGVCGCPAGRTGCARICRDLLTDPLHCGTCTSYCTVGAHCAGGACACPAAAALKLDLAELAALRPACDSPQEAAAPACKAAVHRSCQSLDCFDSGFGPPAGHSPQINAVMCVRGKVSTTTYATLRSFVPTCDGTNQAPGQDCVTAISRYCASIGAVTGFGPIETAGDSVTVTCLPDARIVRTTFAEVSSFASRCTADPVNCGIASWSYCESLGHAGGFGPVEVAGTDLDVACLAR